MKVIFKKALVSFMVISIVPTLHAEPSLQIASTALLKKASIVAGAVGAGFLLGKAIILIKKFRAERALDKLDERALDFFEEFAEAEAKKIGFDEEDGLGLEFGEEWACEMFYNEQFGEDSTLIVPREAVNVFIAGESDERYHLYRGLFAHELGHALYYKKNPLHGDFNNCRLIESEKFADICVPDDEKVLTAMRDYFLNNFFEESLLNYCWFTDYIKKLDDETFVKDADERYKKEHPKDVHPSNILRAKYFNDRLKALKAKQAH